MIVKGKQQLCTCNDYERHFKSIQGRNRFTLFERYKELEAIVNKHIDKKYRHFLAQPEVDGNNIVWFTQDYHEVPKRLSDLEGQERAGYEKVKNDTLAHYRKAISELEKQNKTAEAETLKNAIKFVNDDFVYCYDGKTVLGIWGMELRDEVREPLGIAMQNAFEKPKKKKTEEEPDEAGKPDEGNPSEISAPDNVGAATADPPTSEPGPEPDPEPEPEPEEPLKVRFFGGEHGTLNGQTEYDKRHGEKVVAGEIPEVVPEEGYRFAGWDKNPVNHVVTENTDFIARYEEIEEKKPWWGFFWGGGCLNWLLLLLLLALLGLLLWYLLGRHSLNFCGCDCGCNEATEISQDPDMPVDPDNPTPHTGDVQILLKWDNTNDLDIHCIDPSGDEVYYGNRNVPSGGELDIDMNAGGNRSNHPIENIYWPTGGAPKGQYSVALEFYSKHDAITESPYTIKVKHGDKVDTYTGTLTYEKEKKEICTFVIE